MANNLERPFTAVTNFGTAYSDSTGFTANIGFSIAGTNELEVRILGSAGITKLDLNTGYTINTGNRSGDGLYRQATLTVRPGMTVASTDILLFRRMTAANSGLIINDITTSARAIQNNIDRIYRTIQDRDMKIDGTLRLMKTETNDDGSTSLIPLVSDVLAVKGNAVVALDENLAPRMWDVDQLHAIVSQARSRITDFTFKVAPIGVDYRLKTNGDRQTYQHDAEGNPVCSGDGVLTPDVTGLGGPTCVVGPSGNSTDFIVDADGQPLLRSLAKQGLELENNINDRIPTFHSITDIEGENGVLGEGDDAEVIIEKSEELVDGLRRLTFMKDGEVRVFHHREWHIITSRISENNGVGHLEFFITINRPGRQNVSINYDHAIRDPVVRADSFPITMGSEGFVSVKAGDYITMNFAWKANTLTDSDVRFLLTDYLPGNVLDETLMISYREIATIDAPDQAHVARNSADINTNRGNITKNVTAIAANKAAIQNNATDIASNTSAAAAIKTTADAAKRIADLGVIATSVEFRADDRR